MAAPLLELEGTWEEIRAQAPDFSGRKLRVLFFPGEERNGNDAGDPRLSVLREIEERSRQMNPKPDQRDYLREGRAGGMFGNESVK